MATCRKCGVVLTEENRYPSLKRQGQNVCNVCNYLYYQKPYRLKHRKQVNEREKAYRRRHQISTDKAIFFSTDEIDRPDSCPVCGSEAGKTGIQFHHWEDDPLTGMWVCLRCHNYIHLKGYKGELKDIDEWYERYRKYRDDPVIINVTRKRKGRGSYKS